MSRCVIAVLIAVIAASNIYSQKVEVQPRAEPQDKVSTSFKPGTIELITPWIIVPGQRSTFSSERHLKSCLDFETLSYDCNRNPSVSYGDRIGVNWDLFHVHGGVVDRTRMVAVGKFDWTDKFTVPYIEPWPALAPGEKRAITFNGSGMPIATPAPSKNESVAVVDMNGDGTFSRRAKSSGSNGNTYATANIEQQVSSTVRSSDGKERSDAYSPMVEVKRGYMYVVHVVDRQYEYFVLIHVDDVVHGESIKLSFIKIMIGAL